MENKRYTNCWPYWMLVATAWLLLALAMSGCSSSRHSVTTKAESAVTEDSVAELTARAGLSVFTADSTEVVFTADSVVTPRGVVYNPEMRVKAKQPRKEMAVVERETTTRHSVDSVDANVTANESSAVNPKYNSPLARIVLLLAIIALFAVVSRKFNDRTQER